SDWYLPAIEELNILYEKREAIGDFKYGFYWSSTESNTNDVWNQNFNFGSRIHNSETNNYRVRCVRR
ncbi:MAG: DUF1566 domain-containing protein, partial [Spartobacteria bacterium]|nr:DUF1566 domain-containing protein [Spartobacteria bacterium]